jgi:hypothetical protein
VKRATKQDLIDFLNRTVTGDPVLPVDESEAITDALMQSEHGRASCLPTMQFICDGIPPEDALIAHAVRFFDLGRVYEAERREASEARLEVKRVN